MSHAAYMDCKHYSQPGTTGHLLSTQQRALPDAGVKSHS